MNIAEGTPTSDITIQGQVFTVPRPYTEGHTLLANEAEALNQVLAENLRNNFASKVAAKRKELDLADEQALPTDIAESLQNDLNGYVTEYEFGARRGGGPRITDPVEREARNIARDAVREAIRKKGLSLKDYDTAAIDALVDKYWETNGEAWMEQGRQIIAVRAAAANQSISVEL